MYDTYVQASESKEMLQISKQCIIFRLCPLVLSLPRTCAFCVHGSNACFGFDKTTGWTFFDLTTMHDALNTSTGTVLEADFYHADQLLPQSDQDLVAKASAMITYDGGIGEKGAESGERGWVGGLVVMLTY